MPSVRRAAAAGRRRRGSAQHVRIGARPASDGRRRRRRGCCRSVVRVAALVSFISVEFV